MRQADLTDPPEASARLAGELALLAGALVRVPDRELPAAFASAAAPNSLRAFRSDVIAFDSWRLGVRGLRSLSASPQVVVEFLKVRVGEDAAPASLARSRASLAQLHRLSRLPDPCQDELVKLTAAAHRRDVGVAQRQARPLRFKGAVKDPPPMPRAASMYARQ